MSEVTKIRRLLVEALDVAFYLCNNFAEKFGCSKIFDIIDQILPTAFVLNTSYWVYYTDMLDGKQCVCGRYGIYCRHVRNETHWINLKAVDDKVTDNYFVPALHGNIAPKYYRIYVKPCNLQHVYSYDITLCLFLQNTHSNAELLLDINHVIPKQYLNFSIKARYQLHQEYYQSFFNRLTLIPHPTNLVCYGMYVEEAKKKLLRQPKCDLGSISAVHLIRRCDISNYTLILLTSNVPMYHQHSHSNLHLMNLKVQDIMSFKEEPLMIVPEMNSSGDGGYIFSDTINQQSYLNTNVSVADNIVCTVKEMLLPYFHVENPEVINLTEDESDKEEIQAIKCEPESSVKMEDGFENIPIKNEEVDDKNDSSN